MVSKRDVLAGVSMAALAAAMSAQQTPIPVGADAYLQWDRWSQQRIGMRAYMRSTYDRSGGNEAADASHFLYQTAGGRFVPLDLEGPGVLVFSRFNHWHGSPWHFVVDGRDNVVTETGTADPGRMDPSSSLLPAAAFPAPLNLTYGATAGSDLLASPMGFERSFTLNYERPKYGTGYFIFDRFVKGTALSRPLRTWSLATKPPAGAIALLQRAGDDIAPREGEPGVHQQSGVLELRPAKAATVVALSGNGQVRMLRFSAPADEAGAIRDVRLRVTWDDRAQASIDAPLALFFGAGSLENREGREYLVKALPVNIRFHDGRIDFACYFPMPYFRSARVELVGGDADVKDIAWTVRTQTMTGAASESSYFHATYQDSPTPAEGEDVTLLDTRGAEGSAVWTGSLVGTSIVFSHNGNLSTLEGDPRFFFDDSLTPQAQGTGTEEWGGGGDYWERGRQTTLPLMGHPVGKPQAEAARDPDDLIESMYRFLLADLFPFGRNAVIRVEHGGTDEAKEHYESVAYWYGLPATSVTETDRLQVGDAASEAAHRYRSPEASAPYAIRSRYEWGVDHVGQGPNLREIFPETSDQGRVTKGASEFDLALRPDNLGVMLRRKLDYAYPDQRAQVFVRVGKAWRAAGVWYLAGSNTAIYANARQELGPVEQRIETSNRRFRDDEFLIPRALTAGRRKIRVRVRFTAVGRPLFSGAPIHEQGWSEIRYTAYCFVRPKFAP